MFCKMVQLSSVCVIAADIKFCLFSVTRQLIVAKTDSMNHVEPQGE